MTNHPKRGRNTYDIRVPGRVAWATLEDTTIHAARQEAHKAQKVTGDWHTIYLVREDGERERVE